MEYGGDKLGETLSRILEDISMVDAASNTVSAELRQLIEGLVDDAVERRLEELLGDPDEGLEVREDLIKRLKAQQLRIEAGDLGRPMEEIKKELGLQ